MTAGRDVPAAVPVAWSNRGANLAPDGSSAPTGATTTTRLPRRTSSRVGRRALSAVRASLSARDWDVLRGVASHRYLSTRQVEGFWFADHATPLTGARVCRRVLRRLAELHVLVSLERRVGGVRAGSASFVWQVGPAGDRLLRDEHGTRSRPHEPGRLFLDHCLAVADAHLALVIADRRHELEVIEVQTEPDCWRRYTGLGGARLVLQPDLYAVSGDPRDPAFVNCWFVEIDRGTENPKRLINKCARYETYRRSGSEQADGGSFPLVLWVMPDTERATKLTSLIQRDTSLDERLFQVTTGDQFLRVICGGAA